VLFLKRIIKTLKKTSVYSTGIPNSSDSLGKELTERGKDIILI
jgi:hypothetical protein